MCKVLKNTTILLCVLSIYNPISAQDINLDSLWGVWNDPIASDTNKMKAMDIISWDGYLYTKPDSSFYYAQLMYDLAESVNNKKYMAMAINTKGMAMNIRGEYNRAIELFQSGIEVLDEAQDEKGVANFLNNIGMAYGAMGDHENALEYYGNSLRIREKLSDTQSIANSLYNLGTVYSDQGAYDSAIVCFQKNIKLNKALSNDGQIASALSAMGIALVHKGLYQSAINHWLESLKKYEAIGDKQGMAGLLINIGSLYFRQKDYEKVIEYSMKGLTLSEELGYKPWMANALNNIGSAYQEQGNHAAAMDFMVKSLNIKEEIGNKQGVATSLDNIGVLYRMRGDFERALEYHNRSLELYNEIDYKLGKATVLNNIGILLYEQGKNLNALNKCEESLTIANEINAVEAIMEAAKSLVGINRNLMRYEEALDMHELYITMRDSLESEENKREIIRHEYQYEYEKQAAIDSIANAKEIQIKEAEIAQQKAEVRAKRNQQYALFGGLGLLTIFGGFMYNRFRVTAQQKNIIATQKAEVETQRDIAQKEHAEAEKQKLIVEEKNREILDSIQYAKRLQDAILPPVKLVRQYFEESFIIFKPKDIVSGDFYWMERKNDLVMFAVADCTGHGVPGALVSVVCANALNKVVNEIGTTDPGSILNKTRTLVVETFAKSEQQVQDGMDISLCVLNEGSGRLLWAGANNPLWVLKHGKESIDVIKADKQPIGLYENSKPFQTHSMILEGGDIIYLFSDGFADQFGGDQGKKLKSRRFEQLILDARAKPMDEQKANLESAFDNWKKDFAQVDDVCVIGVKMKRRPEDTFTPREREVLQQIVNGLSNKLIADKLNISQSTVETHRKRILKKARAGNLAELIILNNKNGWV